MEKLLECVKCRKVGLTPWQTCFMDAHIKCRVCHSVEARLCPTCSDNWNGSRQRILEKVAIELETELHCSYPGCEFRIPANAGEEAVANHFLTCPNRTIRCHYETRDSCNWTGTIPDFFLHVHNTHCEKSCNRLKFNGEDLEWHSVPGRIRFDTSEIETDENWSFHHFLRTENGSMGLLVTVLEPVAENPDDTEFPAFTFGWYHKLIWYSKPLGRFVDTSDMRLQVTLHHQERKVESHVLVYDEEDLAYHLDSSLSGIMPDGSRSTFLPLEKGDTAPKFADLELLPGSVKRKRDKTEEQHTRKKKKQKKEQ